MDRNNTLAQPDIVHSRDGLSSTADSKETTARATGFALSVWLVVILGAAAWWALPWKFVPDDALFYLVMARRFVLEGSQSFSGVFITNGVHPLHFYLLTLYSWAVSWLSPELLWNVRYAIPYSVAVMALAAWNLLQVEKRLGFMRGAFALPVLTFAITFPVLYSEAQVSVLALSIFARVATWDSWCSSRRRAMLTGLAVAAVALARLDSVFVCMAFVLWVIRKEWRLWKNGIWLFVGLAVLWVPYALSNLYWFGGLVPVSGWLKSGFPTSHFNLDIAFEMHSPFSARLGGYNIFFGIVPVCFAAVAAGTPLFRRARPLHALGFSLLIGALAHVFYTMTFAYCTKLYWYYVLSEFTGSFYFAAIISNLSLSGWLRRSVGPAFVAASIGLLILPHGTSTNTTDIEEYLAKANLDHHVVMVSDGPGILAFCSHNDIIAVDMLTANRPMCERVMSSQNTIQALLEEARQQGKPVEYILYVKPTPFVSWDDRTSEFLMHSPKWAEQAKITGRIKVGEPVFASSHGLLKVWKLPDTK